MESFEKLLSLEQIEELKIAQGKKVLCLYSTGCKHCKRTAIKLDVMIKRHNLDKSKSETLEATTPSLYGEKLDVVDLFEKRSSNYIFAVDTKESIDVTTTEQLITKTNLYEYRKEKLHVGHHRDDSALRNDLVRYQPRIAYG